MNKNRIYWGGLLILGGAISLLWAIGLFDKGFLDVAYTLWPVILIVFGISVIFKRMPLLKLGLWIALVVLFVFLGINRENLAFVKPFDLNWFNRLPATIDLTDQIAREFDTQERKTGSLGIIGSNLDIILSEKTEPKSEFVYLDTQFTLEDSSSSTALDFSLAQFYQESTEGDVNTTASSVGRAEVALDAAIPWQLNLEADFLTGDLDLRQLAVDVLSIKTAAGDMTIQLGSLSALTRLEIDAAAASFTVDVPSDVGVKVIKDGLITSFEYNGPHREEKDFILSENYEVATKKLEITFSNAIGEFVLHHDGGE